MQRSNPDLETILVDLQEVGELLCRCHPIIVEGTIPGGEVLEGVLVGLQGLLILVDIARLEQPLEARHVLGQHVEFW